jgi:hypothetical protein
MISAIAPPEKVEVKVIVPMFKKAAYDRLDPWESTHREFQRVILRTGVPFRDGDG